MEYTSETVPPPPCLSLNFGNNHGSGCFKIMDAETGGPCTRATPRGTSRENSLFPRPRQSDRECSVYYPVPKRRITCISSRHLPLRVIGNPELHMTYAGVWCFRWGRWSLVPGQRVDQALIINAVCLCVICRPVHLPSLHMPHLEHHTIAQVPMELGILDQEQYTVFTFFGPLRTKCFL